MASSLDTTTLTLHGYYKSSCAARLRIALAYKSLPFQHVCVDYSGKQHKTEEYARMNPSKSVPTLVIHETGKEPQFIAQSVAALEYLEEAYPDAPALLPSPQQALERAHIRSLVHIITSDVQPVTNTRVLEKIAPLGYDEGKWGREFHERGIAAFEESIRGRTGSFSAGDTVTMADVCLAPAIWNALRWGVELDSFPAVKCVFERLMEIPAFRDGHWRTQPDCPDSEK